MIANGNVNIETFWWIIEYGWGHKTTAFGNFDTIPLKYSIHANQYELVVIFIHSQRQIHGETVENDKQK